MNEKKKLYEKGWFSALMLFLFFPVGAFLLWKYHCKHKILNVVLTVVFGFVFLIVTIAMFLQSEPLEEAPRQNTTNKNTDMSQNTPKTVLPTSQPESADNAVATEPTKSVETSAPIATVESIPELSTEQSTEQTAEPKPETQKTSAEELRTLFFNYANSKNSSVKNRLLREDSKELYDVVILTLQTVPKDPSRSKITAQTELDNNILENIKSVCGTYLEIFDTAAESDKIKELREYAVQLTEKNALTKKYESDNGNLLIDESEGVYSMNFYIQNALGVTADSSIDRFLLDLGVYGNNIPQSYGGTIGYEEAFGTYLPSDERCVVQPLSEYTFSQAGIYALNVIYGGDMEVVDSQGFKSFVPVYVEVSNEFVEQFSSDRYSFYDIDYDTLEKSIKSYLLGN